jgi:hypothetical protein
MGEQNTAARVSSWAVPTRADDEAWARMTRDEQLAAYRAHFDSPSCSTSTDTTVADIVERSREKREAKSAPDGQDI